jgi:hypothetical protein
LAITPPYSDAAQRAGFFARQRADLIRMGLLSEDGVVNAAVADWIKAVCFPDRWLDLRYLGPGSATGAGELLRGVVAQRGDRTVVALRSAQLITFTVIDVDAPSALVPVLCVGLAQGAPARFDEFSMPMRVGARADERLRGGTPLSEVLDYLGIPASARPVVESVFSSPRSYVEIVAGCQRDGRHDTTEVGMSIVDTPGTAFAIAVAIEQLTANLPDGQWFSSQRLVRDFSAQAI